MGPASRFRDGSRSRSLFWGNEVLGFHSNPVEDLWARSDGLEAFRGDQNVRGRTLGPSHVPGKTTLSLLPSKGYPTLMDPRPTPAHLLISWALEAGFDRAGVARLA